MNLKILYPNQVRHLDRLVDLLDAYGVACDTSSTGSGKTIVAVKVAKKLQLPIVIVGPPTLRENWDTTCRAENVDCMFISSGAIKEEGLFKTFILVVDEFHLFKNASQRNVKLHRLSARTKYVLLLSATLFDHPRQRVNIQKFIGGGKDVFDVCSQMKHIYPTFVDYWFFHALQTDDEKEVYKRGYKKIQSSNIGPDENQFVPGIFQSGLKLVHASLIGSLIRYVQKISCREKVIVSIKFKEHFELFLNHFPNALVLNGSTTFSARKRVISLFQEPNMNHRILALTDVVGGVGVDLDDQNGEYPRHVVCLPTFATDFIQLVGRVRRRNTRSNSKVIVVQAHNKSTYFTKQMKIKGVVLARFDPDFGLEKFKRKIEHVSECSTQYAGVLVDLYVDDIIKDFCCSCPFMESSRPITRRARRRNE